MPLTTQERASRAGRALQSSRSPEERREAMRKVRLAAGVKAVWTADPAEVKAIVDAAPELTPEQTERLRAILAPAIQTAA